MAPATTPQLWWGGQANQDPRPTHPVTTKRFRKPKQRLWHQANRGLRKHITSAEAFTTGVRKKMVGGKAYWAEAFIELIAMAQHYGIPAYFATFTAAEEGLWSDMQAACGAAHWSERPVDATRHYQSAMALVPLQLPEARHGEGTKEQKGPYIRAYIPSRGVGASKQVKQPRKVRPRVGELSLQLLALVTDRHSRHAGRAAAAIDRAIRVRLDRESEGDDGS